MKEPQQQLEEWFHFLWEYKKFDNEQFYDAMFELTRIKLCAEGKMIDFERAYNIIAGIKPIETKVVQ